VLVCTNAYTGGLANPLGQSVIPVTSVQVATAPLSSNVAASILPQGHAPSDTRRLLIYFRKDAAGRFIIGGRGAMADRDVRKRQQALRETALRLYPQLEGVTWSHAWGGSVAITRDHLPGLHQLAPGVMAGLGYNGRGVGMATVMGKVLARWACGTRQSRFSDHARSPHSLPPVPSVCRRIDSGRIPRPRSPGGLIHETRKSTSTKEKSR
jgi:glycine/D-amino acid oxidase-like deaminating enzyme